MMRAEELMVGDWVIWKNRQVQIASVSGIVYSFGQIDVVLAHCNDDNLLEKHDIKSVSPIPLTPEILEKNGWISDNYNDRLHVYNLRYSKGHSTIAISDDGKWSIEVSTEVAKKDKRGRADLITFVRDWCDGFCVHELQHALRLCGIDKEIVI